MKTNDFIKLVQDLGYVIDFETDICGEKCGVVVGNSAGYMIGSVDMQRENTMRIYGIVDGTGKLFDLFIEYAKTPLEEREEKRYIVPLPGLVTTDGRQQYLTQKGGTFFACRRKQDLRQTWKEGHLCHLPTQYRGYAVEVEE